MTSTSIRDTSPILNFLENKNQSMRNGMGELSREFGSAMSKAADRMNRQQPYSVNKLGNGRPEMELGEKEAVAPKEEQDTTLQVSNHRQTEPTTGNSRSVEPQKADEKTLELMAEAGQEAVKAIAEELGISEEKLLAAMEMLGMAPISLLDAGNLTELVLYVSGEDAVSLVTNEEWYGQVNRILERVAEIKGRMLEKTGMASEDWKAILEQAGKPAEEVPEEKAVSAEAGGTGTAPTEKGLTDSAEETQKITILVEQNGEITEITAETDDKGNLVKTKEVTTAQTESTGVQSNPDAGTETKDGKGQGAGGGSEEQGTAGKQSILETLLQNRTQLQPETESPAFVPITEHPDTEQIMRQIMDYVKIQMKPEMTQLEMQLHPESLGTLHIRIAAREGVVTAQFTAQNESVKAVLESQILELKESLRSQGIKVEAVEVNVQSQSFDSNLWQGKEGGDKADQGNRRNSRRTGAVNLNQEELPEEMSGEEQMTARLMAENGGTVDFTA